ncbi:MAG: serine/threonine protein kinase [Clostridia bacterium]|nr:serine/threonine protein kinase [Clostridia bacterium]
MTRAEYEKVLRGIYGVVSTLSRKEDKTVLRLRHRALERDLVLRSYPGEVPAYEYLKGIRAAGLPAVYDVIRCEDGSVVLEEWIEGSSLAEMMEEGRFSYKGAKSVLLDLCEALNALHRAGFVHRDIKPANVIVLKNGRAFLVDQETGRAAKSTPDTHRLGTTGYAAPEQYVGASSPQSDVYALGVVLNVMLTGHHPSETLTGNARARRIVQKATAMNPESRFPDAAAFAESL